MKITIRDIDKRTFEELFAPCQSCLYWEAPGKSGKLAEIEAVAIKRGWFEKTDKDFGDCGKILYVDSKAAGFVQYAPPHLFEEVAEYSSELFPPSPDGILISCLHIQRDSQGKGLGTRLLKAVIEDLKGKGYQAMETYSRDDSANNTSGPTVLYLENGFKSLKTKKWGSATYSLMRLELQTNNQ